MEKFECYMIEDDTGYTWFAHDDIELIATIEYVVKVIKRDFKVTTLKVS